MTDLLEEFKLAMPANRRLSGGGWINFNCPSCDDRRYRGGVVLTPSGGWRYRCFNGGCEFNMNPTGWEPGNGFGGRPRKLFELIGGNIRRIPIKEFMRWDTTKFSVKGDILERSKDVEIVHQFPEVELPSGSVPLMDVYLKHNAANKVMQFAVSRLGDFAKKLPLYWCEKHAYYLIMPYVHYNDKVVGYLGRHIYKKYGAGRFIQQAPKDYLFNQHLVTTYGARYLFVVESPMDAMLLGCMATRNDRLTEKQINLLKVSGKDIVMIPDFKKGEWEGFIQTAKDNQWFVSIPQWTGKSNPDSLKSTDMGQSIQKNGLLYTIETVMKATTRNYERAKIELAARSV
jgi:hypothetical protein